MDSRIRGNAYSLQYDSTGDPGEAQGLVLQAVRSIDTTLTAVARGSGVVFVKLKDQLSFVKHARRVQEALSTDTVTISTPTIHSKFDSRSAIFTNTPAVSAPAAPSACVAPPSLTSTPSLARAIEEDTLLDYVERHQRVQWEGYVVKITISPTLFGRVVLGDMQGAGFFNDTTGEVSASGFCCICCWLGRQQHYALYNQTHNRASHVSASCHFCSMCTCELTRDPFSATKQIFRVW